MMAAPQNRRGMVYLEHDDSSSGEFAAPGQQHHHSSAGAGEATLQLLQRPSTSDLSPGGTVESEDSYDEIYSSSSDEDSYHSECDDIAEYWDPYCKQDQGGIHISCLL